MSRSAEQKHQLDSASILFDQEQTMKKQRMSIKAKQSKKKEGGEKRVT